MSEKRHGSEKRQRAHQLSARLSDLELELITEAAARSGMSRPEWVRAALLGRINVPT